MTKEREKSNYKKKEYFSYQKNYQNFFIFIEIHFLEKLFCHLNIKIRFFNETNSVIAILSIVAGVNGLKKFFQ